MTSPNENSTEHGYSGPLAWMAENTVAANLLMAVLMGGGILLLVVFPQHKQEVFPQTQLNTVTVQVPYPGATPTEVEQGVIVPVEEAVRDVDDIDEIRSTASEGSGSVVVELLQSANTQQARTDIESAVSRITSFPEDVEDPVISIPTNNRQVITLILYGDTDRHALHRLGEKARKELLQKEKISVVEVQGLPAPEISIEVPQTQLRRYDLTLDEVARRVRQASVEMPGGDIETKGGEILLRTTEERERGADFRDITIIGRPNGTRVTLGDIANIDDTFKDTDRSAYYDGKPSIRLKVFRVGNQTPIEVSDTARSYLDELENELPPTIKTATWNDSSEAFEDRINLILENSGWGLLLVLFILGLFLEGRLAFWVTLGIPITFLGAILFMPALGVSINMISLFAFLLTLGIVVDDAIVVGEVAFKHRRGGKSPVEAAIAGVYEVGTPIVFAVLTTCIAFSPLLFVPGMMGEFFQNIPLVVIPILLLSLVECLLILPAHVAHKNPFVDMAAGVLRSVFGPVIEAQERFSRAVETFIDQVYRPIIDTALRFRYITLAISLSLLMLAVGYVGGGFIKINFMPKIEGDIVNASVEMPVGTPVEKTKSVMDELIENAETVSDEIGTDAADEPVKGIMSDLGAAGGLLPTPRPTNADGGSHLSQVAVELVPAEKRDIKASDFTEEWRRRTGEIPGIDSLSFSFDIGPSVGADVAVELRHEDRDTLEKAAKELASKLEEYNGVYNIKDGFQRGKAQLNLELKPAARALGVTEADLAQQIKGAFFGAEAKRDQRGREEMRIYVRKPEENRKSEHDLEQMMIQTPRGGDIPLEQAAEITRDRSYTEIERENGNRAVDVTGDVNPEVVTGGEVMSNLKEDILPTLMDKYKGLSWEESGQQQERAEALSVLFSGLAIAVLIMFALMAIAFRSYAQPFIIMCAIPFGIVGALGGHIIMGYNLSLISFMGMVALSGVVVNDTLVLIARINDFRDEGKKPLEAVVEGGTQRFRPILLTSLTTFFGLAPMISETSIQARFLIPMAISLGFGVLFVTVIALVIVPTIYMIFVDVQSGVRNILDQ